MTRVYNKYTHMTGDRLVFDLPDMHHWLLFVCFLVFVGFFGYFENEPEPS